MEPLAEPLAEPPKKRMKSEGPQRRCVMDLTDDGDTPILDGAVLLKKLTGFPLGIAGFIQDYAKIVPLELKWAGEHRPYPDPTLREITVKQDRPGHLLVTSGCPLLYLDLDYERLKACGRIHLPFHTWSAHEYVYRKHQVGWCPQCQVPKPVNYSQSEQTLKITLNQGFLKVDRNWPAFVTRPDGFTFQVFIL